MGIDRIHAQEYLVGNLCCRQTFCAQTYDLYLASGQTDIRDTFRAVYKDITDILRNIRVYVFHISGEILTSVADFLQREGRGH